MNLSAVGMLGPKEKALEHAENEHSYIALMK